MKMRKLKRNMANWKYLIFSKKMMIYLEGN